jgi:hypothetical protein
MWRKVLLIAAAISISGGMASAADMVPPPAEPEGWTFTLAPYGWAAGIHGEVGAFGLPAVDVDESFSDILQNFDIGLMGAAEARYQRFSFGTDLLWVNLSAGKSTPHGILADSIDASTDMLMVTGVGAYSVVYEEGGNLDVMAGARLWSIKNSLDVNGGVLDGVSVDDDQTWVDPVVGLKGRVNLTPEIYLTGWGMIGGFGVSSQFMWDAMGAIGYQFTDSFSMIAGYRGLGVDYRNDGFVYDVTQYGPLIGAVFRF